MREARVDLTIRRLRKVKRLLHESRDRGGIVASGAQLEDDDRCVIEIVHAVPGRLIDNESVHDLTDLEIIGFAGTTDVGFAIAHAPKSTALAGSCHTHLSTEAVGYRMSAVTGTHNEDDPLGGLGVNRRQLIKRAVVGTAFAVPVVASFDMASLGVSSAYANTPNQFPGTPPKFTSATSVAFEVGQSLTFGVMISGTGPLQVTKKGTLPAGVKFTPIDDNFQSDNDLNATISGTPKAGSGGAYPVTLHVYGYDTNKSANQKLVVTVSERPEFTSKSSATLHAGKPGGVKVTTSGYPHATITHSGSLPNGMHFAHDPAKGTATISGTPQSKGTHKIKLSASNGVSPKATQELTIKIT
jgi:hypothetical protein